MKERGFTPICIAMAAALCAVTIVGFSMVKADGGRAALIQPEYMSRVFAEGKIVQIDVAMDEDELDDMLTNAMQEEFHISSIIVDGTRVDNVAIRTKGNSSLFSIAGSRSGKQSSRFSFKIDFNEYVKGQNLWGLEKLNLNNCFSDPTYMREYITYGILEDMGLATPGRVYVSLSINGKEWGLYLGVEAIEDEFLARSFLNAKGDLYKPDGTGSDLKWIGEEPSVYSGLNLKTNEGKQDEDALISFLSAINGMEGDIADVLDVDSALKYLSVSTALGNFDSYQGQMKHNYYLYEQDGVFTIIGWDFNMSFGGFAYMRTSEGAAVAIDEPVQGVISDRPLIEALFSVKEYKEKYYEYLRIVAEKYLGGDYLDAITEELTVLIEPYIGLGDEGSSEIEVFRASFADGSERAPNLASFASEMRTCILAQLDGTLPRTAAELGLTGTQGFGGGASPRPAMAGMDEPLQGAIVPGADTRRALMEEIERIRLEGLDEEGREHLSELGMSEDEIASIEAGELPNSQLRPGRGDFPGPGAKMGGGWAMPPAMKDGSAPPRPDTLPSAVQETSSPDESGASEETSDDVDVEGNPEDISAEQVWSAPERPAMDSGAASRPADPEQGTAKELQQPISAAGAATSLALIFALPIATFALGRVKNRKYRI